MPGNINYRKYSGEPRGFGVLEPLQSARSIDGVLAELSGQIGAHAKAPDCELFRAIWRDAEQLKITGELLGYGSSIECPFIALHGDYDPHPAADVREPLGWVIKDFRFYLLERCGHYPWLEQHAREHFFALLRKELEA